MPAWILRGAAPVALMAVIFVFSDQSSTGSDVPEWARIAAHFGQFALLAALWCWALAPALGRRAWIAAAAISLAYAILDEYHQSFVPGRDSDPFDVLVDAAGIATALLLIRLSVRRAAARRRPTFR